MNPKIRYIIGWILTALLGALLLFSAYMKFTSSPEGLKMVAGFGLSQKKYFIIGIVEVISTLLFIIPRTGILGSLLLAAYMGGAIATHLEHFMPPLVPVVIECVIFITAVIRFPELSRRLMGTPVI